MERRNAGRDNVLPFVAPPADPLLGDLRFRALVAPASWTALPAAVRARFSKRLAGAKVATYVGEVVDCRHSRLGWLLAQALRPLGAPLPLSRDVLVPAVVSVTEDEGNGGQYWIRQYGRRGRFPQVIRTAKRFAGPTGLEEYLGFGLGVALKLEVRGKALHFLSHHYFIQLGRFRWRLPAWITPGQLDVGHVDCGRGRFSFTLALTHPRLGTLVSQTALFTEVASELRT